LNEPLLEHMIGIERRRLSEDGTGQRGELEARLKELEGILADPEGPFDEYINELPQEQRPSGRSQEARMFVEWEDKHKDEQAKLREELDRIGGNEPEDLQVYQRVRSRIMDMLPLINRKVGDAGGAPLTSSAGMDLANSQPWLPLDMIAKLATKLAKDVYDERAYFTPEFILTPSQEEIRMDGPGSLLPIMAEWLIRQGQISKERCPIWLGNTARARYLINEAPRHSNQRSFNAPATLSNELYMEMNYDGNRELEYCAYLLEHCGQDTSQFRVYMELSLD